MQQQEDFKPDYNAVRAAIADLLDSNPDYDDGSYGPVLVRLALSVPAICYMRVQQGSMWGWGWGV